MNLTTILMKIRFDNENPFRDCQEDKICLNCNKIKSAHFMNLGYECQIRFSEIVHNNNLTYCFDPGYRLIPKK